jgi:hypothetical protein
MDCQATNKEHNLLEQVAQPNNNKQNGHATRTLLSPIFNWIIMTSKTINSSIQVTILHPLSSQDLVQTLRYTM